MYPGADPVACEGWPPGGHRGPACGECNPRDAQLPRGVLAPDDRPADPSQSQLSANLRKITFQRQPDDVVVNPVVFV